VVFIFFSVIRLYFSIRSFPPFILCQGSVPLVRYIIMFAKPSRSSRRLYSVLYDESKIYIPNNRCELMLEYPAVPMKCYLTVHSTCHPVFGSIYYFDKPKSTRNIVCSFLTRKFSGLTSLCMIPQSCTDFNLESY